MMMMMVMMMHGDGTACLLGLRSMSGSCSASLAASGSAPPPDPPPAPDPDAVPPPHPPLLPLYCVGCLADNYLFSVPSDPRPIAFCCRLCSALLCDLHSARHLAMASAGTRDECPVAADYRAARAAQ